MRHALNSRLLLIVIVVAAASWGNRLYSEGAEGNEPAASEKKRKQGKTKGKGSLAPPCTVRLTGTLCDGTYVTKDFVGEEGTEQQAYSEAHGLADQWEDDNCMCSGEECNLSRQQLTPCDNLKTENTNGAKREFLLRCRTWGQKKVIVGCYGTDCSATLEALTEICETHHVNIIDATRTWEESGWLAKSRITVRLQNPFHHIRWDVHGEGTDRAKALAARTAAETELLENLCLTDTDHNVRIKRFSPRTISPDTYRTMHLRAFEYVYEDGKKLTLGVFGGPRGLVLHRMRNFAKKFAERCNSVGANTFTPVTAPRRECEP